MSAAMQILNQVGHVQHWGISPAVNFLSHWTNQQPKQPIRVLLTGTSDIRHILKTLTDISIEAKLQPKKIQIYFHETNKQLICRALLFLHIIHETNLNFQERIQLFLDLYGNALIKQRNSRYLDHLRVDLLNFIHSQKKINTPLKKFVSLKMLKFQERDELSEFIQSWSNKAQFDMVKLRDQRLRYLYKQRYDFRANLTDWDYNMLLSQFAPIIHFYHYKEWRMTGLAFQQRFSTYTQPNRTLASYIPGRKKVQRTSCLVRGYWGDLVISPYIAMGIDTNSQQKQLLFKKANLKHIGHAVQLTQYNLTYWLTRLQTGETYNKHFRDYYRTDDEGRKKLQKKQSNTKKKAAEQKDNLLAIKQQQQQQTQDKNTKQKQQQKQQITKNNNEQQQIVQQQTNTDINSNKQQQPQNQDLDSEDEQRRQKVIQKNKSDIPTVIQLQQNSNNKQQGVLPAISKYGVQFLPICTPTQNLVTKGKFKQYFDVIVIGFFHSASMTRDIQSTVKSGGFMYVEKARYIVPKRKQQRKELDDKLKMLGVKNQYFKLVEDATDYLIFQNSSNNNSNNNSNKQ